MTTTEPRTDQEILDRSSMDDVDAIADFNPDPDEVIHAVKDQAEALLPGITQKVHGQGLTSCMKRQKIRNGMPKLTLTGL